MHIQPKLGNNNEQKYFWQKFDAAEAAQKFRAKHFIALATYNVYATDTTAAAAATATALAYEAAAAACAPRANVKYEIYSQLFALRTKYQRRKYVWHCERRCCCKYAAGTLAAAGKNLEHALGEWEAGSSSISKICNDRERQPWERN